MTVFLSVVFFILGAICASFALVVAARISTGQSFVKGRSRCDACGKELSPRVLIPIVSYFFTKGRASCCGAKLSYLYPLSEFLLGALFVLSYLTLGLTPALFFCYLSLTLLFVIVRYDLMHTILPIVPLVLFIASSFIMRFLISGFVDTLFAVALSFFIGIALFLIYALSRGRAMGFADAPLAFGLGIFSGTVAIAGFAFSFWVGAIVGVIILLRLPKNRRIRVEVPFAPFLAVGFLLAFFTQWNPFLIHLL